MTTQMDEFKKCIVWRKYGESWSGTFSIPDEGNRKGFSYSIAAAPNKAARFAKPDIAQGLFTRVNEYCFLHNLNINEIIKKKLLAKPAKK